MPVPSQEYDSSCPFVFDTFCYLILPCDYGLSELIFLWVQYFCDFTFFMIIWLFDNLELFFFILFDFLVINNNWWLCDYISLWKKNLVWTCNIFSKFEYRKRNKEKGTNLCLVFIRSFQLNRLILILFQCLIQVFIRSILANKK